MNLLSFILGLLIVSAPPTRVFTSPDRTLRANVSTTSAGESRVQIEGLSRRVLLVRDDTSRDGSHGHVVIHSAWTADSQFFVAGTESSGGHQPWARPIWIYSRARNRVFELEKLGAVAVAGFTLKAPDKMEIKVLGCGSARGNMQPQLLILNLRRLVSAERLVKAPCAAH